MSDVEEDDQATISESYDKWQTEATVCLKDLRNQNEQLERRILQLEKEKDKELDARMKELREEIGQRVAAEMLLEKEKMLADTKRDRQDVIDRFDRFRGAMLDDTEEIREQATRLEHRLNISEKSAERKIEEIYDAIEHEVAQKKEFTELADELKALKVTTAEMRTELDAPRRSRTTTAASEPAGATTRSKIKFTPPTFEGRKFEQPMRYLRDLKAYLDVTDADQTEVKYIITQSLKGSASEWWHLVEDDVNSWKEFDLRFRTRYWSETKQAEIRRKLEFGFFEYKEGYRRCEYAMSLYGDVKNLTTQYCETDIINLLASHFNEDIRSAVISREINSKERFFQLLERYDNSSALNRGKPRETSSQHASARDDRPFTHRRVDPPTYSPKVPDHQKEKTERLFDRKEKPERTFDRKEYGPSWKNDGLPKQKQVNALECVEVKGAGGQQEKDSPGND